MRGTKRAARLRLWVTEGRGWAAGREGEVAPPAARLSEAGALPEAAGAGTGAHGAGTRRLLSDPPGPPAGGGWRPVGEDGGFLSATHTDAPRLQASARLNLTNRTRSQKSEFPENARCGCGDTGRPPGPGGPGAQAGTRLGLLPTRHARRRPPPAPGGNPRARGPRRGGDARRPEPESPSSSGPRCWPAPSPEYLGRNRGRVPEMAPGRGSDPPLGHIRACAPALPPPRPSRLRAQHTPLPARLGPGRPGSGRWARRAGHLPRTPCCFPASRPPQSSRVRRQQCFIGGAGVGGGGWEGTGRRRHRLSESPEEEPGASVQGAGGGVRLSGQQLAQGGPVLGGEPPAAQL